MSHSLRGPGLSPHGAVVHDNGGYGMLGAGHGPDSVIESMSDNWVMANVMTASFSQKRLDERLRKELGHARGWCPFEKFICMNSGSESVSCLGIADVNAKLMTQKGGKHEETIKMAIEKGFHGRTDRPLRYLIPAWGVRQAPASFQNRDNLILIPANDVESRKAFNDAAENNVFIELLAIEPVQDEGNPGQA